MNRIILCLLLSLFISNSCKKEKANAQINNAVKTQDSFKIAHPKENEAVVNNDLQSFVLSCGSGCAMTYTSESVTGNLPDLKVKFKVEMYVDEQLSDTYNEVYVFSYNQSGQIQTIYIEGKNDNVLKTLLPEAQRSFREFADGLITRNKKINTSKSESSKIIYDKKSDPQKATYKTIETSSIKGLEKFSCDQDKTRYIPIPGNPDIKLLLVPQDCGDFQYRYYLIAVKDNKVTGNLYVEGEWYEPDNEEDKEVRYFSIDSNYNIIVNIKTADSSTFEKYIITDNGFFVKK